MTSDCEDFMDEDKSSHLLNTFDYKSKNDEIIYHSMTHNEETSRLGFQLERIKE